MVASETGMRDYSRQGPPWHADYVLNPFKYDEPVPVEDALRRYDITKVKRRFGTWAVTEYGVECLVMPYAIPAEKLRQPSPERRWSFEGQLLEKRWTVERDVVAALAFARGVFSSTRSAVRERSTAAPKRRREISLRLRYRVLRRDGYRCQLCGRTAADGVTLHLDHRVPWAKGGATDEANLRTLCVDCNLGKGVQDE